MSDYFDSFKLFLYERVSNPLVTAFAFSWVIFNYAFFLIAFSGDDVAIKLVMISALFETTGVFGFSNFWLKGLAYPLLSASAYIFLLPLLSKRIVNFHYTRAAEIKNIKNDAEGLTLVTKTQAKEFILKQAEAERNLEETEIKYRAQLDVFEKEVRDLKASISEVTRQLSIMEKEKLSFEKKFKETLDALELSNVVTNQLKESIQQKSLELETCETSLANVTEKLNSFVENKNLVQNPSNKVFSRRKTYIKKPITGD